MSGWSLYLVRCRDGSLYTGITTDVERRFAAHCNGTGAKYLRGKGPLTLEFSCEIGDKGDALRLEHLVKRLGKEQKEAIVRGRKTDAQGLFALMNINRPLATD